MENYLLVLNAMRWLMRCCVVGCVCGLCASCVRQLFLSMLQLFCPGPHTASSSSRSSSFESSNASDLVTELIKNLTVRLEFVLRNALAVIAAAMQKQPVDATFGHTVCQHIPGIYPVKSPD